MTRFPPTANQQIGQDILPAIDRDYYLMAIRRYFIPSLRHTGKIYLLCRNVQHVVGGQYD
jgi:hypothetical protein